MIENTSTLYKMIILYMLKKVTFPLSNSQITNFLLDHEYTTYFHIQQTIHDLMDTHLILERKQGNSICYEITPEGQKTLSYFEKNTPYANFTPINANQSVHQKEALFPRKRSVWKF